jgi:hypothetical protein
MRKEVYCSSSRALCAPRSGASRRSRTTCNGQKPRTGNESSVVCVRETQYARGRPARAQQRSVRVRASKGYGCRCGVLTRGQRTIYAEAGRVHGRRVAHIGQRSINTDTI